MGSLKDYFKIDTTLGFARKIQNYYTFWCFIAPRI